MLARSVKWVCSPTGLAAGLLAAAVAALPVPAHALEYCVVCAGPDAAYRCQVDVIANGRREAGAQLVCITTLAQEGGHQSCSVRRTTNENCQGLLKIVALPDPGSESDGAALAPSAENSSGAIVAPRPVEATTGPGEKQKGMAPTVEALAKETAQSSGETIKSAGEAVADTAKAAGQQIEKAGGAISGAAKKTWGCIASLFSDCK